MKGALLPEQAGMAAAIVHEFDTLAPIFADSTMVFRRPLEIDTLPTAPVRGFLGDALARAWPGLFAEFFEPGRFHGRRPAAFALQLRGVDDARRRVAFRIVAWDPQAALLPAFHEAAQRRLSRGETIAAAFEMGALADCPRPKRISLPGGRLVLDSPVQMRRYGAETPHGRRERRKLQSAEASPEDILHEALNRLSRLAESYGTLRPVGHLAGALVLPSLGPAARFRFADARAFGNSFRQRKRIDLGGIVGEVGWRHLNGDAALALQAASCFNIGKSTAYGCGALTFSPSDYSAPSHQIPPAGDV